MVPGSRSASAVNVAVDPEVVVTPETSTDESSVTVSSPDGSRGISVPLEGGYANLRKFLQAVEGSDKFLVVERVALARGKQGGRMLDLNISLATYFMASPELVRRKRERS